MIKSVKFAGEGIYEMAARHTNFQRQLGVGLAVVALGLVTGLSIGEWMILFLTVGMVLGAEMVNSAIESVVDLVTEEKRLKAKAAKDIAAGMVLFTSLISVIIGLLLFLPKLL